MEHTVPKFVFEPPVEQPISQPQAVMYLMMHFANRVKNPNRRLTLFVSRKLEMKAARGMWTDAHVQGFATMKGIFVSRLKENYELEFVKYICQYILDDSAKPGALILAAEIAVNGGMIPPGDLDLLNYCGRQLNLSESVITNILHFVQSRSYISTLAEKEAYSGD